MQASDHHNWQGPDVRYTAYNPDVDAANLQEHGASFLSSGSTLRGSRVERDWAVSLDDYTMVMVWGSHKRAFEINANGQRQRGALTNLPITTLCATGHNGLIRSE